MKKVYMKPLTELTACIQSAALMEGSNFYHGEAKGGVWGNGGPQVIENGKMQGNENLWDD